MSLVQEQAAARERETVMSSCKPIAGQCTDLCSNETFSCVVVSARGGAAARGLWGRVHLAGLREEVCNRVEQLAYIEGFRDPGEVTFLKRSRGQVGAHDNGGDGCEV